MSATNSLRRCLEDEKPFEVATYALAQAILELADRLDKLEADPSGALSSLARYKLDGKSPPIAPISVGLRSARTPEQFKITVTGTYKMRNGRLAQVKSMGDLAHIYPWETVSGDPTDSVFRYDNGRKWSDHEDDYDIVEGPLCAPSEGWINIHRSYGRHSPHTGLQGGVVYQTREEADAAPSASNRVDCVKVLFRVKEASAHWRTIHDPSKRSKDDAVPF